MDDNERIIEVNVRNNLATIEWLGDPTRNLLDTATVNGQSNRSDVDGQSQSESSSRGASQERNMAVNVRNNPATVHWHKDPTRHLLDIPAVNADAKRPKPAFIGSARAKAQHDALLAKGD